MGNDNDVTVLTLDSGQKVRALEGMEQAAVENDLARRTTGWQAITDPGDAGEREREG